MYQARYSAKKVSVAVNFMFYAPEAQSVSVVGNFNHWYPNANPMTRRPDGAWSAQIELHSGHHQYLFLVDGVPTLDPRAQGVTRNSKGERVSMMSVS